MIDPSWVTAAATVVLAVVTWLYVRKLDEGRDRSIEPHLMWQDPRRAANPLGGGVADFSFVVTNVGAGIARLTNATATSDAGDALSIRDLRLPSTLEHVPYTFHVEYPEFVVAMLHGLSRLELTFDYTDVEGRRCYRSRVVLNATQELHGATSGPIDFLQADERPARSRRIRCRPSVWSRIRSHLPGGGQ